MKKVQDSLDNTHGRKPNFLQGDKFLVASFPSAKNNFIMILSVELVSSRHPLLWEEIDLLGKTFLPGASRELTRCYILISSQDAAIVQTLMKTSLFPLPMEHSHCSVVKEEKHGTSLAHRREVAALCSCVSEVLTLSIPETNTIQHYSPSLTFLSIGDLPRAERK